MAISIRGYDSWLPDEEPRQAQLIDGFDDFFANRFPCCQDKQHGHGER